MVIFHSYVSLPAGLHSFQHLPTQEPIFDLTALASSLVDSSGLPAVAGLSDGALGAEECPEKGVELGEKSHVSKGN